MLTAATRRNLAKHPEVHLAMFLPTFACGRDGIDQKQQTEYALGKRFDRPSRSKRWGAFTMTFTIAVFGITGQTGLALSRAALARGWHVRGLARSTNAIPESLSQVHVVRGGLDEQGRIQETVEGADAACCVLGPRPPYTDIFCAQATKAIIRAMEQAGSRRLLCQTGAMIGAGNRTWAFEALSQAFARRQPAVASDRVEQERVVQESDLDWTLIKPPRLTNQPARQKVKASETLRVGLMSSISRADIAFFMLDAMEHNQFIRSRLFVRG